MKLILLIYLSLLPVHLSYAAENDVVIVHSYGDGGIYKWPLDQGAGFRKALGDGYIYHEYFMKTKKIPESAFDKEAKAALSLIQKTKPKLVYFTDDNALRLVGPKIDKNIFIVFSGINGNLRTDYPWVLKASNIDGVLERPMVKRSIIELMSLFENKLSKVYALFGKSVTGQKLLDQGFGGKVGGQKLSSLTIESYASDKLSDWKEKISSLSKNGFDAVMVVDYYKLKDDQGKLLKTQDVIREIAAISPVPIFTVHANYVGKGMLTGTVTVHGSTEGIAAGEIASKLIKVGKRSGIPQSSKNRPVEISLAQVKKYKLKVKEGIQGVTFLD